MWMSCLGEGGGGLRGGRAMEQDRIAAMEHLRPGAGGTLRVDTADDHARQVFSRSLSLSLSSLSLSVSLSLYSSIIERTA